MNRRLAFMGLLIAVASILFTVESLVNLPIPWFKLGLANVVTLLALEWWGLTEALIIVVLRSFLGGVLTGKLFHPDLMFSLLGGITAALAMEGFIACGSRWFGYVGISIIGALIKNATQLVLAYILFIRHAGLFSLVPLFLIVSLASGLIVGFLSYAVNRGMAVSVSRLTALSEPS